MTIADTCRKTNKLDPKIIPPHRFTVRQTLQQCIRSPAYSALGSSKVNMEN